MKQCHRWIEFIACVLLVWMPGISEAQSPGSLIWKSSTGWVTHAVAASNDVNGDGTPDVFAGSGNDSVFCYSGRNGDMLWGFNYSSDAWAVASLSDVNGDGINDCLAGGAANTVVCLSGKPESGATHAIWTYATGGDVWTLSRVEDLNGDGINDCLAGAGDNKVYCLNGSSGALLWSYETLGDVFSVDAVEDLNGDGKDECVAGGNDNKMVCISGAGSGPGTGTLLWSYEAGSTVTSVKALGDVNGDGKSDCLAGGMDDRVHCISGSSSGNATVLWSFTAGSTVQSVSPIKDVNSDGRPDCLAGGMDDKVHCISGINGSEIWSYAAGSSILSVAPVTDVNGSGSDDCIAGGEDNLIYCIEGNSSVTGTLIWSYSATGTVHGVAASSDLNGNGAFDILAASDDSYVYTVEGGLPPENAGAPSIPSGPSAGAAGQNLSFTASGASSNLGHEVEYRFDWGDGSQSAWGAASQARAFNAAGAYAVKAQARCKTHTGVVSAWSSALTVTVSGHALTVAVTGSGSVTKNPDKAQYNHNESVALTAVPASGNQFDRWEGALTGTTNPGTVSMTGDKSVTAVFTQTTETVGTPAVPAGSSTVKAGQSITLTTGGSTSNLGHEVEYRFDWGDGSQSAWGAASQARAFNAAGAYAVKAQARCKTHTGVVSAWSSALTVTVSGHALTVAVTGSGSVTKNPDKAQYNHNESVVLTAAPAFGYQFNRWEGALTGTTNPGTVSMTGDKSVTAVFTQTTETVGTPAVPAGSSTVKAGQSITLTTGGSTSNLGHEVEYRFDWGDGSQSAWGAASQARAFNAAGAYAVKAQARCKTHTGVVSAWSSALTVTVSGHALTVAVTGSGSVTKNPDKAQYNHNESVALTAVPASGNQFDRWEGALTGTMNIAAVVMTGDKSVTAYFVPMAETVSNPVISSGPFSGSAGATLTYTTYGAVSNLGHPVQYQFNWSDGQVSAWGPAVQSHAWTSAGSYVIRAQARCAIHTSVVSGNSFGWTVAISAAGVEKIETDLAPTEFGLGQNYPNPFNGETRILCSIPEACDVVLEVFSMHGEKITTCASGRYAPGVYRIQWNGKRDDGSAIPSGIYMVRMAAGNFRAVKTMLHLK